MRRSLRAASRVRSAPSGVRASSTFRLEELDEVEFPREQLGLDYAFNWSLARDGVVPSDKNFRNLDTSGLYGRARGELKKTASGRVLHSSLGAAAAAADPASVRLSLSSESGVAPGPGAYSAMHPLDFEDEIERVQVWLSTEVGELFVQDACVGSSSATRADARVVCDDATYGLAFKHLLVKVKAWDCQADEDGNVPHVGFCARGGGKEKEMCRQRI